MKTFNRFSFHFFLSSAMLLAANAWFLFKHHNIPDGRIFIELPVTSALILLYMFCFGAVSKKTLSDSTLYLMTICSAIISVAFMLFAINVQQVFQNFQIIPVSVLMTVPRLGIFSFMPYLVILGIGIGLYSISAPLLPRDTSRVPLSI